MKRQKKSPELYSGKTWFNSMQIRGYMAHLKHAIISSTDGAYAQLDLTTAKRLYQICEQAKHTEEGHEHHE